MFYFYVLRSGLDNNNYYGSTSDLKRRLSEHQSKKVKSTRDRLPLNLVYYEAYKTLKQARSRELQVKSSGSIRQSLNLRIYE